MICKQIIPAFPKVVKREFDFESFLRVSEFFADSIQGEGVYTGHPATFLRLQGCPLGCIYCDTTEVWRQGNPYSFPELFQLMEEYGLIEKFRYGQHLVITGGSPLLQQKPLTLFLEEFGRRYDYIPFVEVENECFVLPDFRLAGVVDCWNNSPKLGSSQVPVGKRYHPEVVKKMGSFANSWFKFVIQSGQDWDEIKIMFLETNLIQRDQIILMPEGATREEINSKREMVMDLAIRNSVRFSDRLHIQVWDRKVGV